MNRESRSMNPRTAKSLLDAISACTEIEELVGQPSLETFLDDRGRQLIAERLILVVGESLHQARIDDLTLEDMIPDLAKIVGMRNVIAHGYRDILPEIVWEAAVLRVPPLRLLLVQIVDQFETGR